MASETAPLATQDKLKAVQARVEVGKQTMNENIHKQLANSAATEDLEEGAAMLKGCVSLQVASATVRTRRARSIADVACCNAPFRQSEAFKVDATKARRQEMFKSWKFNLLIAAVALLIFVIFILPIFASEDDGDGDRRR